MKDFISKLTWVDYIAIVAVLRGLYVGYKSGFFQEVLRVLAYALTLVLALQFEDFVAQQVTLHSMLNEETSKTAAFGILLVVIYLILKLIRMMLAKTLKMDGGGGQKVLGAALGAGRWLILLSFVFMFVDSTPLKELKTDVHERSLTGPYISQAAPALYDFLSQSAEKLGFQKPA